MLVMVKTRLSTGAEVDAAPNHDDENAARARSLGYAGSDVEVVEAMTIDHDQVHQALALMLGLEDSPTLRLVSEGEYPEWASLGDFEERVVFLLQAALTGKVDVLERLKMKLAIVRPGA